jgi:transcriptional regulator with XRE-family HTH domain
VHRAYVSQLERGLKTPTLETPFAIAAALEVSPAEVLKRVEERVRHPDRSS